MTLIEKKINNPEKYGVATDQELKKLHSFYQDIRFYFEGLNDTVVRSFILYKMISLQSILNARNINY
jgi:hypothetical protein